MSPISQAILTSWSVEPKFALSVTVTLVLYWRGWRALHRASPQRFPTWRAFAFTGGLIALWLAVASPLDAFSAFLLSAHMVQHLLLLLVAPPLTLMGAPFLPLLRGLPRKFARDGVGPFLVWPGARRVGHAILNPVNCWIVMAFTLLAWHVPAIFDLALRSPPWHRIEHGCFFGAALLFWWPVVRPFPSRPRWPLWSVPLYLLSADLVNTTLSAILTFADHVLYPQYLEVPRLFGTTALGDQSCAGLIMWVPASLFLLIPAALTTIQSLSSSRLLVHPHGLHRHLNSRAPKHSVPARIFQYFARARTPFRLNTPRERHIREKRPFDLLCVPLLGPFLRARSGRRILQASLFIIATAVIVDGILGPQVGYANLAGVLPWTYWRVFVVIALLAAGNFFCMACPFMLFRELGRRLGLRQHSWPREVALKMAGHCAPGIVLLGLRSLQLVG